MFLNLITIFPLPGANSNWIWTLKLRIFRCLFYHCATAMNTYFLSTVVVVFKSSNFRSWVECSTTLLPLPSKSKINSCLSIFGYSLTPGATCGCIWTLKLWITSRVFYHYATAANQELVRMLVGLFLANISLQVPDVVVLEPSNFESLAECFTTVQLQLTKNLCVCLLVYVWLISHSRYHLWLHLNPQTLNH